MESSDIQPKEIIILHFNDVYNLKEREKEPVGGAARFITAAEQYKDKNPLVLFSGDIFSPSKLASIMKGKQMLPFFDNFKIDVSCVGNHDLDFGIERFITLKNKCQFPWLLTNVFETKTAEDGQKVVIAECLDHVILDHSGVKIGVIGLAEADWLDCLPGLDEDDFLYEDFIESAKKWNQKLRDQGCELVIALTHMRMPNDKKLAEAVPELDLILGGHDHCSDVVGIHGNMLAKSGTDFREFSIITMTVHADQATIDSEPETSIVNKDKHLIARHKKVEITKEFAPHEGLQKTIDEYWVELDKKLEHVAGYTALDFDARFTSIRTIETNVGNFVADAVRFTNKTDCCLLNSGCFRTDEIIPTGILKWRDIDTLFPIQDEVVVIRIKGEDLLKALENGVSATPKLEGKFPCISGIRMKYDTSKPAMERILECEVNGEPLDKAKSYTLTTKSFLYDGKDGYDAMKSAELLRDGEVCLSVNNVLINHFKLMTRLNKAWFSVKKAKVDQALELANNTEHDFIDKDADGKKLKYRFYKIYPKLDGRLTDVNAQ